MKEIENPTIKENNMMLSKEEVMLEF